MACKDEIGMKKWKNRIKRGKRGLVVKTKPTSLRYLIMCNRFSIDSMTVFSPEQQCSYSYT
jgi:hypothetical protein